MEKPNTHKLSILLAEDDPDDSLLFLQAIDELNIPTEVHVSADGEKLVEHLKQDIVPGIIFLDINMPLKNGIECLSVIRSKQHLQKVPVIIYSTSQNKKEIKECFERGANYYVAKPFTFGAIIKMLNDFCLRDWSASSRANLNDFVVAFD